MCVTIDTPDEFVVIERNKEHEYVRSMNCNDKWNDDGKSDLCSVAQDKGHSSSEDKSGNVKDRKDDKQECVKDEDNQSGDNTNVSNNGDSNSSNDSNNKIPTIGRLKEPDILLGAGSYFIDNKFNLYRRIGRKVVVPVSRYALIIYLQFLVFAILMSVLLFNRRREFPILVWISLTMSIFMCIIPITTYVRYLIGYETAKSDAEWCGLFCGKRVKVCFDRVITCLFLNSYCANFTFIILGSIVYYVYNFVRE